MAKQKPVNVEIIKRTEETEAADGVYGIMNSIIAACRPDLADVAIGLAWRYGWKPNVDGFLRVGFCKKRGDLDRALDAFDFVILLNAEAWPEMTESERRRLMHHELCNAQVCVDENGDTKFDTGGRPCCRVRKHDIEEFFEVAEKYGLKSTINQIAQAAAQDADRPLLKLADHKGQSEEADEGSEVAAAAIAETADVPSEEPVNEPVTIMCKGMKQAELRAILFYRPAQDRGYGYQFTAKLGNYDGDGASIGCPAPSRAGVLKMLKDDVRCWLNDLAITGTADQKRAMARRRDMMAEQVTAALDTLIAAAEEVPFKEDSPRQRTAQVVCGLAEECAKAATCIHGTPHRHDEDCRDGDSCYDITPPRRAWCQPVEGATGHKTDGDGKTDNS